MDVVDSSRSDLEFFMNLYYMGWIFTWYAISTIYTVILAYSSILFIFKRKATRFDIIYVRSVSFSGFIPYLRCSSKLYACLCYFRYANGNHLHESHAIYTKCAIKIFAFAYPKWWFFACMRLPNCDVFTIQENE